MILITITCLTLCYLFYYFSRRHIYRLAAKIPGPRAYPIIGNANLVLNFEEIRETCNKLFEEFGSTIRIWIFYILVVMVTDPKHLQIIFNSPHCLDKEKRYKLAEDVIGNSLILSSGNVWKHQRKQLNPAFGQKIVDSFVETFIKHSEIMVEELEKEVGKKEPFDVNQYVSRCSLDFICETAMGVEVNAQRKNSKLLEIANRINEIFVLRGVRVWLHLRIIFRLSPLGREFYKLGEYIHNFTDPIVNQRYDEVQNKNANEVIFDDTTKKPFLEHLLTFKEKLSREALRSEVEVFIVAGSDTVSVAVQYVLVALGMHKEVQEKVREELNEVFGQSKRPITIEDLPKLKYLEMALKETMRVYTPIPFIARSITQDIDLGEYVLPAGGSIIIPIASVHRNPKVWPEPSKFDPDRFLPEQVAKRHPYSFIPFAAGPRNCIGKAYAMYACKIMLATFLRSYKIDTKIRPELMKFKLEVTSKLVGGANITIEKV